MLTVAEVVLHCNLPLSYVLVIKSILTISIVCSFLLHQQNTFIFVCFFPAYMQLFFYLYTV